jgi:tetratricopeptide (TPR) repeat protein
MFYSRARLLWGLIALPIFIALRMSGFVPDYRARVYEHRETPEEIHQRITDLQFDRGVDSLNSRDYEGAIDFFTRVIGRVPDDAAAYGNRAIAYERQKDFPHALADFDKALKLDPDKSELYSGRGLCYLHQGDHDRALADFNQAIRRNTHDADCFVLRGYVYAEKNSFDLAMADYSQALKLDPLKAAAYAGRGLVYSKKKDHQHSLEEYQKAIELDPKDSDHYVARSGVYTALKEYDRAEADLTAAIELDADNSDNYLARGSVRQDKHDYERAIEDYADAIRHNSKELLAFNNLAWILATCPKTEIRDGGKAVEYALYICKESEWKKTAYFDTLAAAYAASDDFDQAVKWQEKALASADTYDSAEEKQKGKARLELYRRHKPYSEP